MKDGKAEIGTETRKPEGSKPPGVTADRFPMTHGTMLPEGKWKEISAEFDAVGTTVNEKKTFGTKVQGEFAERNRTLHNGRKCGHGRKT